jgi:serine phosphatase RsbU (regulator of sigma subunit)
MDISLVSLNLHTMELQWSGANNPLWYIQNGTINEIKGDKQPIGYHPTITPFTNHVIQLQKRDVFFLFTDGYADQFGGEKGKKFKYKKMQEFLFANASHSMKEQKQILNNTFDEWKSHLEQVDDVLVIGVRV